jgi:hypothetical protein
MTVSRRSNSTPTEVTESPRNLLPIEKTLLSATGRKIKIRQDGSDREVSVADAIIQRQVQSALTGSTHAQGQVLKGIFRAERARAKIIKADIEIGKWSKELAQERVEKAITQGEDSDLVTPTPTTTTSPKTRAGPCGPSGSGAIGDHSRQLQTS